MDGKTLEVYAELPEKHLGSLTKELLIDSKVSEDHRRPRWAGVCILGYPLTWDRGIVSRGWGTLPEIMLY